MKDLAKVYVGTSGFTYAHWGGGVFYPADLAQTKWLEYYSQHFTTVEINASFYHLPKRTVFENWHRRTPKNFVFSVKGSRFITHVKKIRGTSEPLERFFAAVSGLSEKLQVVLWQLPPGLRANPEILKGFLELIRRHPVGRATRQAFEFRHESWFTEDIYAVLRSFGACLSIAHSRRFPCAEELTADFVYLRFHGGSALYASNYSRRELAVWAKKCKTWLKEGKDIYAYFNNDVGGYAVANAKTLTKLL